MGSLPYRILAGPPIGVLIDWCLPFRVSVADSAVRMLFAVGIGPIGLASISDTGNWQVEPLPIELSARGFGTL